MKIAAAVKPPETVSYSALHTTKARSTAGLFCLSIFMVPRTGLEPARP